MSARVADGNGWIEIKRNPISRAGVFDYSGAQLGYKTEPQRSQMFKVLRPPEELNNPATIESFRLLPWINDHTMLGPNAQKAMPAFAVAAEKKGVQGVIGQETGYDTNEDILYGNIKLFSDSLGQQINGGKVELSAGYGCKYEFTPGVHPVYGAYDVVQRNIRGNHLASVDEGRMGPQVAVMDAFTFTFDSKEAVMADPKETPAADADAGAGTSSMTLEQCTKLISDLAPQVAKLTEAFASLSAPAAAPAEVVVDKAAQANAMPAATGDEATAQPGANPQPAALDAMKAGMDAMTLSISKLVQSVADLKAGAPAAAVAELASRDDLAKRLSNHVGTFDYSAMDSAAVVKYGVDKLKLKPAAGHERTAVEAYLAGAGEGIARAATVRMSTGMDSAARRPAGGAVAKHLAATE